MNILTRNPPARIARGIVNHHDTFKVKYIRNQSATYGIPVLTTCHTARPTDGS
jgi:hypothetical protein